VRPETQSTVAAQPYSFTRATLKVQWRNALTFAWGAAILLALGSGLATQPATGQRLLIAEIMLPPGVVFLGIAIYLGWSVAQGERQLRQAGLPWKVDRSLLGSERRTLVFLISRALVVTAAISTLHDPRLGLELIRPTHRGARARLPAGLEGPGNLLISRLPLSVDVTVHSQGTGSRVRVVVTPAMVWGAWLTIRSSTNWVADGQWLADEIASGIASKVGQSPA
jgi:hypothetical protein